MSKKIEIGKRLKEYRLSQGMTLVQFAKIIGISHGSLSDIERGKTSPSAETLSSLVRHTDINPTWLLIGEGPKNRPKNLEKEPNIFSIQDVPLKNMIGFLIYFWKNASQDERIWLKVQFSRCLPEFEEFLKKEQYISEESYDSAECA